MFVRQVNPGALPSAGVAPRPQAPLSVCGYWAWSQTPSAAHADEHLQQALCALSDSPSVWQAIVAFTGDASRTGPLAVHAESMDQRRQAFKDPEMLVCVSQILESHCLRLLFGCCQERDPLLPGVADLDMSLQDQFSGHLLFSQRS